MTVANLHRESHFHPFEAANQRLRQNVFPDDWVDPEPDGIYNLVVIGAGSAGLITAAGAAGLGAKVALIERNAMGGDCLNVGCVPSKALLAAGRKAAMIRAAGEFGIRGTEGAEADFSAVMERLRSKRADISPVDSARRFKELGVDVFLGGGRFLDGRTVEVNGKKLRFAKAVIATGARAIVLPIPGLKEAGALTNETVFSLTSLPRRLAVIGAGPIGCEMAQAFRRLGSEVTLFEAECRILPRDEEAAAAVVAESLKRDGVEALCDIKIRRIEREGEIRRIIVGSDQKEESLEFEKILVGVGRAPNVDGMGLEEAGVDYDPRTGIKVDEQLRTSNRRIFSAGDVCLPYKFTHSADASARIVIQNALFGGKKKHTDLLIPWCTYTDPELAHVGLDSANARKQYGEKVSTFVQEFDENDRNILDGSTAGFVMVHAVKGRIVGATIVGSGAGDLISEISVAMRSGMNLSELAAVIHPYPTNAEAIRKIGDAYKRTLLTPFVKKLFQRWLAWSRR